MSFTRSRASRIASSCPKDFDFQFFVFHDEGNYMSFYGGRRVLNWLYDLPERGSWNALIAFLHIVCMFQQGLQYHTKTILFILPPLELIDVIYNAFYLLHIIAIIYNDYKKISNEEKKFNIFHVLWCLIDLSTYITYFKTNVYNNVSNAQERKIQIIAYFMRLPRTFKYLWALNDYYLNGTILSSLMKYWYFFIVMRIIFTFGAVEVGFKEKHPYTKPPFWLQSEDAIQYFRSFFQIHKLFLQISTDYKVTNIYWRCIVIVVTISGCVIFVGLTITAVAHIVCTHIRAEEVFHSRYQLIVRNFYRAKIEPLIQHKVMTFYDMYWHKQKAVSSSKLLEVLPPSFANAITLDIYFEALQKTRVLRDMSYQFLTEVARVMTTVNYVPGDFIIRRAAPKSIMYFITYGDVEIVSAEDDETPILRLTRGSIINPCGICVEVAAAQSHVAVRAATFCTAHVLRCDDLWRVTAKYGRVNGQSFILHSSFEEHFERIKKHYSTRKKFPVKHKSSILLFKRNLIELKKARDADGRLLMGRLDKFIDIAGCYIMRNVNYKEGSSLTEETDAICLRSEYPCILQPRSSLLFAWNALIAILTLFIALLFPYQMAYLKTMPEEFYFFNWAFTFLYGVDLIVLLSTGDKIEEGVPVTFTQTSSQQIKKPIFIIDLLATVPFMLISGYPQFVGLNKLIKIPRIFLLLRGLEKVFIFKRRLLRFIQYIIAMVLIVWLIAAFRQGFFCFGGKRCDVTSFTNRLYWSVGPLNDGPTTDRLLISVSWALALVTFTDVRSRTDLWFSYITQLNEMLLLEICTIYRILMNGLFSATIMVNETLRDEFNTCITTVKNFLHTHNVDKTLKARFLIYLQLCWHGDKAYSISHEGNTILFDLPAHVHREVMANQRHRYLKKLGFWRYLNKEAMQFVAGHTKNFFCAPNEVLRNTGDIIDEIIIVRDGFCEVYDPVTKEVVALVTSKAVFGDVETILRVPVYHSVRTVTNVQLYTVPKKYLMKVLMTPQFTETIRYCQKQPEFQASLKRREPFLIYEPPPPATSRTIFPRLRKHQVDYAYLYPFQRLGFFSVLRYVFPRFTIRPDGAYLRGYEWFRAACAFLYAVLAPVYIWIKHDLVFFVYLRTFLDITGLFDIMQRMLIGYYDERGLLISHPASTAAHYVKTAFIVDFLGVAPFEHLDKSRTQIYLKNDLYLVPDLYQFLHFNRVLQLYRTVQTLETLKDVIQRRDIMLVIKYMPVFLSMVSVITAVVLAGSADKYQESDESGVKWRIDLEVDPRHGSWVWLYNESVLRYNITDSGFKFILTTCYWVLDEVTTTSFRNFAATNQIMLATLTIGSFTVTSFMTFIAMRIISIRSNVNKALATFQEHMKDLSAYMKREKFSKEFQKDVTSYYAYNWEMTGGTNYRAVLKLCNQMTLRTDAILHIYGPTFTKNPILRRCEQALLRQLGRAVYSMYFEENVIVINEDGVIEDLYFIDYGTMEVYEVEGTDIRLITKLPRGSCFGLLDNKGRGRCSNKFVARASVHLFKINTTIFHKIIRDYPKVQALLVKFRPHNENYIIGTIAGTSKVMTTWKDRAFSSAIMAVTKQAPYLKYLSMKTKPMQIYLILVCLASVYTNSYNASFVRKDKKTLAILYGLDAMFLIKLILNYILAVLNEEQGEFSALRARKKKYSRELKFDVLSILPLELFAFGITNTKRYWRTFAVLRLNRLFRVVTLQITLKHYKQQLSISLMMTTVATVLIWFTMLIHFTSCLWYSIGLYQDSREIRSSWRYAKDERVLLCKHHQYVCSIYFVICTFMELGVGDIAARNEIEVIFVCILMALSAMIFMIYVGEFSNVLQFQNFRVMEYYSKRLECDVYLKNNHVAAALVDKVKRYTLYLWREQRGLQMPEFISTAPQGLRHKIMATAYIQFVKRHEVFKDCEPAFLRQLAANFRVHTYMEGMFVVKEGEISDAMFFVQQGFIKEVSEDFDEELREYEEDHIFCTVNGLADNIPVPYSYKVMTLARVLGLHFTDWKYLLDHFPISKEIIMKKKDVGKDSGKDYDVGMKQAKKKNIFLRAAKALLREVTPSKKDTEKPAASETLFESFQKKASKSFLSRGKKSKQTKTFEGIPSGRESRDRLVVPSSETPVASTSKDDEPATKWPTFSRFSISKKDSGDEIQIPKQLFARRQSVRYKDQDIPEEEATTEEHAETTALTVKPQEEEKVQEKKPKEEYKRRQSTVHDIDRSKEVAEKLKLLEDKYETSGIEPEEVGKESIPDDKLDVQERKTKEEYKRRQSTVHDIDRSKEVAKKFKLLENKHETSGIEPEEVGKESIPDDKLDVQERKTKEEYKRRQSTVHDIDRSKEVAEKFKLLEDKHETSGIEPEEVGKESILDDKFDTRPTDDDLKASSLSEEEQLQPKTDITEHDVDRVVSLMDDELQASQIEPEQEEDVDRVVSLMDELQATQIKPEQEEDVDRVVSLMDDELQALQIKPEQEEDVDRLVSLMDDELQALQIEPEQEEDVDRIVALMDDELQALQIEPEQEGDIDRIVSLMDNELQASQIEPEQEEDIDRIVALMDDELPALQIEPEQEEDGEAIQIKLESDKEGSDENYTKAAKKSQPDDQNIDVLEQQDLTLDETQTLLEPHLEESVSDTMILPQKNQMDEEKLGEEGDYYSVEEPQTHSVIEEMKSASRTGARDSVILIDMPTEEERESKLFLGKTKNRLQRSGTNIDLEAEIDASTTALLESIVSGNIELNPMERASTSSAHSIFMEVLSEPTNTRSVLSFKDQIETVEIPTEDKRTSIIDISQGDIIARQKARLDSMLSYSGDIFLKEGLDDANLEGAASAVSLTSDISVESINMHQRTVSMWSVEGFMAGKQSRDKKPLRFSVGSDRGSDTSIRSRARSTDSVTSLSRKSEKKKSLGWVEEDEKVKDTRPAWLSGPMDFNLLDSSLLDEQPSTSAGARPKSPSSRRNKSPSGSRQKSPSKAPTSTPHSESTDDD